MNRVDGRSYGADLLKVVSMLMIVLFHLLGHGGVLYGGGNTPVNQEITWVLYFVSFCAVDCFAMVSGYVMVDRPFRYARIIPLWLQVAFYSVLITAGFALLSPGTVGLRKWATAFLPVLFTQYWYFTAYFALFFFIPFLNHLLNTMSRRGITCFALTIVAVLSVLPTLRGEDVFITNNGFSFIWLGAMYVLGGWCKKMDLASRIGTGTAALLYVGAVIVTYLSRMALGAVTLRLFGEAKWTGLLAKYTSPTIVLAALALLLIFSRMKFRSARTTKMITGLSALTFGVYLIHDNPLMRERFMVDTFIPLGSLNPVLFTLAILGSVLAIYAVCSAVDFIRSALFRLLRIGYWSELAVARMEKLLPDEEKAGSGTL